MIYQQFHENNIHDERCDFGVWDSKAKEMGICDEPAVGFRGGNKGNRQYLCNEHFALGPALEPSAVMVYEKENKKHG